MENTISDGSAVPDITGLVSAAATSSKLKQLKESLKLEHQFVRVPFEHYRKMIRSNHRIFREEVSAVVSAVNETADTDLTGELDSLVTRLQRFQSKFEERSKEENMQVQRCRARLDHLESLNLENFPEWNETRVKRMLVDYMLRMSYYETAKKIAETYNIQDLVDMDVFSEAKNVIQSLENKQVVPALTWCADNKSKLKKAEVLVEPIQWDVLMDRFKQEFYRLHGMTLEPLLNIFLQAGLIALKTPFCYEDGCTKEDPLSQESFRKLASQLPYSMQHKSRLVCYITKELMEGNNGPLVLPNGYAYGTKALLEMSKNNNGQIICPRTGLECTYNDTVEAILQ